MLLTLLVQPYKYNGKGLYTKKGLNWYDYGARHYDAVLGRWHVADPSSEKYAMWSPYSYCKDNPFMRIDVDGKDDYILTNRGRLQIERVTNSITDKVTLYGTNKFITINDKNLLPHMMKNSSKEMRATSYTTTTNLKDAVTLFKFGADNTLVEWKLDIYSNGDETTALIITDHKERGIEGGERAKKKTGTEGIKLIDMHSHPEGTVGASDADKENILGKFNSVYQKKDKTLHEYNSNQNSTNKFVIKTVDDILNYIQNKMK